MWNKITGIQNSGELSPLEEKKYFETTTNRNIVKGEDEVEQELIMEIVDKFQDSEALRVIGSIKREFKTFELLPGIDSVNDFGFEWFNYQLDPFCFKGHIEGFKLKTHDSNQEDKKLEVHGLTFQRKFDTSPVCSVWDEPELLVIDVSNFKEIHLYGELSEFENDKKAEAFIDYRVYCGSNTFVMEGTVEVIQDWIDDNRKEARAIIKLLPNATILFCRTFRWWRRSEKRFREIISTDPSFLIRKFYYNSFYSKIANRYKELKHFNHLEHQGDGVIIFIHGLCGNCIPSLKSLDSKETPTIYRFEHNTFNSIKDSANTLIGIIRDIEGIPKKITFIGHSRGGLVGLMVARMLKDKYNVELHTYGSPFKGSNLAKVGTYFWRKTLSRGRSTLDKVFCWDPYSYAFSLLMTGYLKNLSTGWKNLEPDSEELTKLTSIIDNFPIEVNGGTFEWNGNHREGFLHTMVDFINTSIHGEEPNDGIVTVDSAHGLNSKNTKTNLNIYSETTHFGFFENDSIKVKIQGLN